jgi:hypothetical protein
MTVVTEQVLATLPHSPSLCVANTALVPPLLLIDAPPSNAQCGRHLETGTIISCLLELLQLLVLVTAM